MYSNIKSGLATSSGMALLPQLGQSALDNILSTIFGLLFIGLALTQIIIMVKKHKAQ